MVIFFFSCACAPAPSAIAAPATTAASVRTNRVMSLLLLVVISEAPSELCGQRQVVAQLLGLEREVHRDEVDVEPAEHAALADVLLGEARALRAGANANRARTDVGRERGEALRGDQVQGCGVGPEITHPSRARRRQAQANRGCGERVVQEGIAQLAAEEARVDLGGSRDERADVESRRQPLEDVQLRDREARRVAGAGGREERRVLHLRVGDHEAEVESQRSERCRGCHALVGERGTEVLGKRVEFALSEAADATEVAGAAGKSHRERNERERSNHGRAHVRRNSGGSCSSRVWPAFMTWPGVSWPTTAGMRRATANSLARSTRVSNPMSSSMFTMSSVQMLPVAPGANGQPPRPDTEPSNDRTPASMPATTFARPMPRVLWKWSV